MKKPTKPTTSYFYDAPPTRRYPVWIVPGIMGAVGILLLAAACHA